MPDDTNMPEREKAKMRLAYDFNLSKVPELIVLQGIVNGWSNLEIADTLGPYGRFSENYVKRVVRGICKKMLVKNRVAAAVTAVMYGLTPED